MVKSGLSALAESATRGDLDTLSILLEYGADMSLADKVPSYISPNMTLIAWINSNDENSAPSVHCLTSKI